MIMPDLQSFKLLNLPGCLVDNPIDQYAAQDLTVYFIWQDLWKS